MRIHRQPFIDQASALRHAVNTRSMKPKSELQDPKSISAPAIPTRPPAITAAAGQPQDGLTLQGLIKAWGQGKTPYDITGNSTVDVDDLLAFINTMSDPNQPPPNQPVAVAPEAPLVDAAPESNVPATKDVASAGSIPSTDATFADPARSEPPTLEGLLHAWGQSGSTYDLNGDGTVNVDDLLQYINKLAPASAPSGPDSGGELSRFRPGRMHRLADALIDRLINAGFKNRPPTNIRELVGKLKLTPRQADHMIMRLQAQYPGGLGVNELA